jgi:Ca-activated chloride channel homolog
MSETTTKTAVPSAGGRLVALDGRTMPLQAVRLQAEASAGIARVVLEQRFVNPYAEPLRVSYLVPLPQEGALAGYTMRVGERRIFGEVDRLAAARERFEEALIEGRSAGLVEQDRSNLFTQEIGNIPPGAQVVAELVIDQRLRWLEEGAWEWRFPTVVAPRYLGPEGRVSDAERVSVDVASTSLDVRVAFELTIRDRLAAGARPESPSHTIMVGPGPGGLSATLSEGSSELDRDVVVRWAVARPEVGIHLDVGRAGAGQPGARSAYGLLTIVPPASASQRPALSRDLIVLFDTSGSMHGAPLEQARRVIAGLVERLGTADRLEMIEFSDRPRRWRRDAVSATAAVRRAAVAWLNALEARGGTEMGDGVAEALRPLRREAQRQVVLVTDGLVGFEDQILTIVASRLPAGSRVHVVGVGPSVNRGLTGPVARAGRGAEVVVGLDEDPAATVDRLGRHLDAPLVTDLELFGSALVDHAPARLPDLHASVPVRVAVELRPDGGELCVRGRTATDLWECPMEVGPVACGQGSGAVVALFARERVEDLEARLVANVAPSVDAAPSVDKEVERLGLEFQIATRLTSWVAVSEEPSVDPTQPTRRERIPHALPAGLSVERLGLRPAAQVAGVLPGDQVLARPRPTVSFRVADCVAEPLGPFIPSALAMEVRTQLDATPGKLIPLTGRIAWRKGRTLAIEITVKAPLQWEPSVVEMAWGEEQLVRAEIVRRLTTRNGRMTPGTVVRLVVRLEEAPPSDPPDRVVVTTGGARLTITLAR